MGEFAGQQWGGNGTALSAPRGLASATCITSGTVTSWTVSASQSVGSPGSPVTFTGSNYRNPPNSGQFTLSFFDDSVGGGRCTGRWRNALSRQISTITSASSSAREIGMRVSHIAVVGPKSAYRSNLNQNGVGIGIAAALGGVHGTTIDHTYVGNLYTLYQSSANGDAA